MKKYKVVVWGTGSISSIAIRCLHDRPDIELIGVWAHEETAGHLIGTDAGLLYGEEPIGITITGDADALIAMKPDCVMVGINVFDYDGIIFPLFERFLLAGINIVGTSGSRLTYPPGYHDQEAVKRLEDAAKKGNASMYISGIEPGFSNDDLVAKILSGCNTIERITATERDMWDAYPEPRMAQIFGFGMPLDYVCMNERPGSLRASWGGTVQYLAAATGYKLDEIRERYEKCPTDRDLNTAMGLIKAGTCGAVRFAVIGVIDGKERIVVQHVNRMAEDLAPEWGVMPRDGIYETVIEGDPNLTLHFMVGKDNPATISYEMMIFTALRAANAISYVCEAKAGIHSSLSIPNTIPAGIFRGGRTEPNPKGYGTAGK